MQQDRSGQDTTPSLNDAFVGPAVNFCTFERVAEIRGVDRVDLLAHPCAVPLSSNSWKPDGRRAEIYYDCAISFPHLAQSNALTCLLMQQIAVVKLDW